MKFDRRRGLSPLHVGLATCDIIIRSSSRINCVEPVSWVLSDQKREIRGGGGGKREEPREIRTISKNPEGSKRKDIGNKWNS